MIKAVFVVFVDQILTRKKKKQNNVCVCDPLDFMNVALIIEKKQLQVSANRQSNQLQQPLSD